MKKNSFLYAVIFFLLAAGPASGNLGQIFLPQEATLRDAPSFTQGRPIGILERNQMVVMLEKQGDWSRIQASGLTGWLLTSPLNLSRTSASGRTPAPRILAPGASQPKIKAESNEIALAGKGFGQREFEVAFRSNNPGLNYAAVEAMTRYTTTTAEIEAFLAAGRRGTRP